MQVTVFCFVFFLLQLVHSGDGSLNKRAVIQQYCNHWSSGKGFAVNAFNPLGASVSLFHNKDLFLFSHSVVLGFSQANLYRASQCGITRKLITRLRQIFPLAVILLLVSSIRRFGASLQSCD